MTQNSDSDPVNSFLEDIASEAKLSSNNPESELLGLIESTTAPEIENAINKLIDISGTENINELISSHIQIVSFLQNVGYSGLNMNDIMCYKKEYCRIKKNLSLYNRKVESLLSVVKMNIVYVSEVFSKKTHDNPEFERDFYKRLEGSGRPDIDGKHMALKKIEKLISKTFIELLNMLVEENLLNDELRDITTSQVDQQGMFKDYGLPTTKINNEQRLLSVFPTFQALEGCGEPGGMVKYRLKLFATSYVLDWFQKKNPKNIEYYLKTDKYLAELDRFVNNQHPTCNPGNYAQKYNAWKRKVIVDTVKAMKE